MNVDRESCITSLALQLMAADKAAVFADCQRGSPAWARKLAEAIADDAEASETHELFWVQLADDGSAIRKWSRSPFSGARKCRASLEQVPA